jgi:hydroxymethylpyrimidine pyrophosphatase-like HAD family hydrolase
MAEILNLDPLPHDPSLAGLARERSIAANLEGIRARLSGVRVAYTDVDGTMMGPGGCFIVNARREYTLEPAHTLVRALEQGLDIFLVSGRNRMGLLETARILGMKNYIAELGVETVYDLGEEVITDFGAFAGVTDRLYDHIESLGVLDYLYEKYPRRLELHTPWALKRDCTPLLRGLVDPDEVNREFARLFPGLQMVDNGIIPRSYPGLDVPETRAYHVVPEGISKEGAVEADMRRRGLRREETVAIGDSEADLRFAEKVGVFFLVHNGLYASPRIAGLIGAYDNVFITEGLLNEGWAEAVETCLRLNE